MAKNDLRHRQRSRRRGAIRRQDCLAAVPGAGVAEFRPARTRKDLRRMMWLDTSTAGVAQDAQPVEQGGRYPPIYGATAWRSAAYFARSTPPVGWLKANGAAVNRVTYALLLTAIDEFGVGDEAFNLPDLRGRPSSPGVGIDAGVDAGRAFGSAEGQWRRQIPPP